MDNAINSIHTINRLIVHEVFNLTLGYYYKFINRFVNMGDLVFYTLNLNSLPFKFINEQVNNQIQM